MERVGLLTDDAGEEVERLHCEPFGRRIEADGKALVVTKGEKSEVRTGFTGHRHDDELGLIAMRRGGRGACPRARVELWELFWRLVDEFRATVDAR